MALDPNYSLHSGSSTRQLYAVREAADGSGRCLYICCQRMFSFTSPNVYYSCGNCGYEIEIRQRPDGPHIPEECPTCYCYLQYR